MPGQKGKQQTPRPKHVPLRTCVACRQGKPKRELVRVVRGSQGAVEIDLTGKKAGRGSYLCRSKTCWELALKKKGLEHALQTTISPEDRARLLAFGAGLTDEPALVDRADEEEPADS